MSYSWNTKFSLEHRQETRDLRRVETFEVASVRKTVIPAILEMGLTPILRAVQPCGAGTGISHYQLSVVTKGDDWTRAEQFTEADKIARAR